MVTAHALVLAQELLPELLPGLLRTAAALAAATAAPGTAAARSGGVGRLLRGGVEGGRHGRPGPVEYHRDGVGQAEVLAAEVGEGHQEPVGHEGEKVLPEGRDRREK